LIEQDNILYPVEIKKTATPDSNSVRHFSVPEKFKLAVGPGAVLCLKQTDVPLSSRVNAIPAYYL
jgi:hypothetical protein